MYAHTHTHPPFVMRKIILVAAPANDRVGEIFTRALLYTKVAGGAYFCGDKKRHLPELCFTQRLQGEHTFVATKEIYRSSALHKGCRGAYFCCDEKRDVLELCFTQRLQGDHTFVVTKRDLLELCFTQRLQGEHTFVATKREIYQSSALHKGFRGILLSQQIEIYQSSALHKGCRGSILLSQQIERFTRALLYTEVAGGAPCTTIS